MTATPAYIEIRGSGPPELFPHEGTRVTIGRSEENDVVLRDDRLISHVHAVIESYGHSFDVNIGEALWAGGAVVVGICVVAVAELLSGERSSPTSVSCVVASSVGFIAALPSLVHNIFRLAGNRSVAGVYRN